MSAAEFLDTNVLVYAYDDGAPKKQSIARGYVQRAVAGEYAISVQVLAEFSTTLLHRFAVPMTPDKMIRILDALSAVRVVQPDEELVRRAVEAHAQYGVHFYDGMILAAAERAGCGRIWSEDLTAGQEYFGVRVENPFA
jgi:predicted nucleic acid-binding protein